MKYGFTLSYGTPAEVLGMAAAAEEAGWDAVFTWDAISISTMPVYDPWVMMGAMAGATNRVQIGAMVLPLARRRPWKVVKEAITIDHLSNGRLIIPVGLGTPDDRGFSGVNTDSTDRRDRAEKLDECLDILALAQKPEPFSYSGKHYQVEDMAINPIPVQEHIPIWTVAGWPKPKSMQRSARLDGAILVNMTEGASMFGPMPPELVAEAAIWLREHREADTQIDIIIEGKTQDASDTEYIRAIADAGATWFIESRWDESETPESLLDRIKAGPPHVE